MTECTAIQPLNHPLAKTTPRYHLCSVPPGALEHVHGVAVAGAAEQLAYYSTIGALGSGPGDGAGGRSKNNSGITDIANIKAVAIIVHGANRNADDYFCAGCGSAALQRAYPQSAVAVLAPRFLEPQDGEVTLTSGAAPMRWNGSDENGVWRYGADSLASASSPLAPATVTATATATAAGVSSYAAMDALVRKAIAELPNLERIAIAGHSSGGQFVQRWALTSTASFWNSGRGPGGASVLVEAVVANPSSFAYLDGRRWSKDGATLAVPPAGSCAGYDAWEYGLEEGPELASSPYVASALKAAGSTSVLAAQYAGRAVLYLAGGADTCNVTVGWCDSHGLETTCADELQGSMRLARSNNYVKYLKAFFDGKDVHKQVVVPHVGHDHSLIFQSAEGQQALFG